MTGLSRAELTAFFRPGNVALVGASDKSAWSQSVFARFGDYGHEGKLFAVNRNGAMAHRLPGFKRIADIPEKVETAFIYVPAAAVVEALREAAAAGVRNAVVLSSGFAEAGEVGAAMQAELAAAAAETGVAMLGPNSLGFANFAGRKFCTSIRTRLPVRQGRLGIVSQSGAIASELAKWAYAQGIGLSFLCATGNEAQLGIADVVDYLVGDPDTDAIALYVEGVSDPARFKAAAARARAAAKPIVMLKLGRSEVSNAVAQAHTGSLVGDDRVTDAMCRRYGVTRVSTIEELISTADFLGKIGPIDPPRIGMVSISGGACGMYADLAQTHGLVTPPYSAETQAALREVLPPFAATLNPLDVTGVAVQNPGLWAETLPVLLKEAEMGLIVTAMNLPNTSEELKNLRSAFEAVAEGYRRGGKPPVILSFSVQDVAEVQAAINKELGLNITLPNLGLGVAALAHLQRWSEALQSEMTETSPIASTAPRPRSERQTLEYLSANEIPVIPAMIAASADEAAEFAETIGGPVVLKVLSPDITHKTECGGVRLNINGSVNVRRTYDEIIASTRSHAPNACIEGVIVSPMRPGGVELIVGVAQDPQWGPVIVAGLGGVFTEALKDSQVRLLPITPADARTMLEELRGTALLRGFRGAPPANLEKLSTVIARIGDAALALGPNLAALEVNPLRVSGSEIECLDGLAVYSLGGN